MILASYCMQKIIIEKSQFWLKTVFVLTKFTSKIHKIFNISANTEQILTNQVLNGSLRYREAKMLITNANKIIIFSQYLFLPHRKLSNFSRNICFLAVVIRTLIPPQESHLRHCSVLMHSCFFFISQEFVFLSLKMFIKLFCQVHDVSQLHIHNCLRMINR